MRSRSGSYVFFFPHTPHRNANHNQGSVRFKVHSLVVLTRELKRTGMMYVVVPSTYRTTTNKQPNGKKDVKQMRAWEGRNKVVVNSNTEGKRR